jgi:kynurenine formamidase
MLYDLTQSLNEDTPVYPGDQKVKISPAGRIASDGFCDHLLTLGTHIGTHIDAPAHMIDNGKGLKDYPIERFVVSAICIDARKGFDADEISQHLERPGLGVLIYTGASNYFFEEKYWHDYPVLDNATVAAFIDKKVSIVGIDTGSFDSEEDFPVHKTLLGADILLLENLTNLAPLAGKRFDLYALPIKLEIDGAPARVVAKAE